MNANSAPRRPRFPIGRLAVDPLTFREALDAIAGLVDAGQGGTVLTPNIDHVVLCETDARLREAYAAASLSLVDGMPVLWASRLLGGPLPEKVSGSDLILPLMKLAAERNFRVYLLGGADGVAESAARHLREVVPGLRIVGTCAPRLDEGCEPPVEGDVLARVHAARPDLILVALGCPKQEIFMHRTAARLRPAVMLGIGAGLDFWAGTARRAPRWVSAAGLEWLYRLAREPRRLWRRYLVRDPEFLWILLRELRSRERPA
jgi:N-acetylglucosaminyldiphosphoundecaprenol N-acetyl-beta-D-mannosaminyltransferase